MRRGSRGVKRRCRPLDGRSESPPSVRTPGVTAGGAAGWMARNILPTTAVLKNLQRIGASLLIIVATLAVYWRAQFDGFVWDDTALVLRDPLIRSWRLIPEGFRHFLFIDATASNFYRPLQRLTFTADYALWEFFPKGWHLTSVYVHIAAALALFFLVEKWLGKERRALALGVALVWAVHPLHTSAVTYVAGRADPLAALFGFGAIALGLASLEGGRRARLAACGAALGFLGALLSKESGVAALLIWFAMLAWRRVPRAFFLKWIAAAALVLGVYGGLRFSAQKVAPPDDKPTPVAVRPILAARAIAEYAGLIVAPVNLRMERDVSTTPRGNPAQNVAQARLREYQTLLGLALVAGLAVWWRWSRRAAPEAALALLCAAIAYLPISNLFSLNATVAEHWLYVPSAFLFIAVAVTFREIAVPRIALRVVLGAWTVWLGVRTWERQADWLDEQTFFRHTIADGGDSARMHVNLGRSEAAQGRDEAALEEFREALKRDPKQPIAMLGFAAESIRLRDFPGARAALDRAAHFPQVTAEVAQLRGALEFIEHKTDATPAMKAAADAAPWNWTFRKRYLSALDQTGHPDVAARELRAFLQQQPFRGDSWKMLGDLLSRTHQREAAAGAFDEAMRLDVHDAEARERARILAETARAQGSAP